MAGARRKRTNLSRSSRPALRKCGFRGRRPQHPHTVEQGFRVGQRRPDPMETETKTSYSEAIVAIAFGATVTLSGWLLDWSAAERVAVLAIIGFVALVTLKR